MPFAQFGSPSKGGNSSGKWVNNLQGAKGSFSFPFLTQPSQAFQLLLGGDADLFRYDAPPLGVDFSYSQFFPVPPIPILGAEIAGRIYAVADFEFGMDTSGFHKFEQTGNALDIFDGFFIADVNENGVDVPEVRLGGSLTAGAKLELLIASAGVRGGVFANVNFNLHDIPDPETGLTDGKIRAGEIARNLQLGPIHIFDVSGKVDAGLVAFVDVNLLFFQIHDEYEIARVNLLDFEIDRPPLPPDPNAFVPPVLATQAGGTLNLALTGGDDKFTVLPGPAANSVIVESNGFQTDPFSGVTKIVGNAGAGNDSIKIDPLVTIAVELSGGLGNDELMAGGGAALLRGDEGDDLLIGGSENDQLFGGAGADTLMGERGDDLLEGGDDDDTLDGGSGADTLRGQAGVDVLLGGRDQDVLEGGSGDDYLQGDRGDDILRGGDGNDQLMGDRGDDLLEGGDGDDQIIGDIGSDTIIGGAGNDRIDGGLGTDVIYGGLIGVVVDATTDADTITGGAGDDTIDGGEGDDLIQGGAGNDTIFGGSGNDTIFADDTEAGGDVVATHVIDGGAGDDIIYGDLWEDVIRGGFGDDSIYGLAGDDLLSGDDGNDQIYAGKGDDAVFGGVAVAGAADFDLGNPNKFSTPSDPNLVFQSPTDIPDSELVYRIVPKFTDGLSLNGTLQDGQDTLFGEEGTDWLFGGDQNDSLFGGDQTDYLDGGAGSDANLFGDSGDDVVRGGAGNDVAHGGDGVDQVYGDEGADELYGDADTDGQRLFGGAGNDSLYAWAAGNTSDSTTAGDQLFGGGGNDFLYGNLRDEFLSGEDGKDFLSGDALVGPNYAHNLSAAFNVDQLTSQLIGSNDLLLGGAGEDQLYGGGGEDTLWGGGDSDWLEGQDGVDIVYGGSGIDILVADSNANYQRFGDTLDGHKANAPGDVTADDNATDILLLQGTTGDDVIRLRTSTAADELRDASGTPLPESPVGGELLVEFNGAIRGCVAGSRDSAGGAIPRSRS